MVKRLYIVCSVLLLFFFLGFDSGDRAHIYSLFDRAHLYSLFSSLTFFLGLDSILAIERLYYTVCSVLFYYFFLDPLPYDRSSGAMQAYDTLPWPPGRHACARGDGTHMVTSLVVDARRATCHSRGPVVCVWPVRLG